MEIIFISRDAWISALPHDPGARYGVIALECMGTLRHGKWAILRNFFLLQEGIIVLEYLGREVINMDALVLLALAVAVVICALPGIMAWSFYSRGRKRASEKRQVLGHTQPAKA
jgi:hypothetical protein